MNRKTRAALSAAVAATAAVIAGSLAATPALAATTAPHVSGGGLHPVAVAFSPSGSTAYVVDQNGFINFDSTSTSKVAHQIFSSSSASIETSGFLGGGALSPDGKTLWVSNYDGPSGAQLIGYSTSTRKRTSLYSLGGIAAGAVAISPDGTHVYVETETSDSPAGNDLVTVTLSGASAGVTSISLGDGELGGHPEAIAVSSDGGTIFATTDAGAVAKIDVATSALDLIDVDGNAQGLTLSKDGSTLYTADDDGSVDVVNTTTEAVTGFSSVAYTQMTSVALTPNGKDLLAVGYGVGGGKTWIYSASTGDEISESLVGNSPWAVAVNPAGTKAYVANNGNGLTSIVTLVNAKPAISSHKAPASGTEHVDYATSWSATGFPSPTYTWTGSLPPDLTLDPVSGELSGTPTTAGVYKFKIVASNSSGKPSVSKTQTVTIKKQLSPGEPSATGIVGTGQTLSVYAGIWEPVTVKLSYQWQRSTNGGTTWKSISKATKTSYKVPSAYRNDLFRVVVTGKETGYTTATAIADVPVIL